MRALLEIYYQKTRTEEQEAKNGWLPPIKSLHISQLIDLSQFFYLDPADRRGGSWKE